MKKHLLNLTTLVFLCLPITTLAQQPVRLASLPENPANIVNNLVSKIKQYCEFPAVESPVYSGQLVSIEVPDHVAANQLFDVIIRYRNMGNQPWFASDSGCLGQSSTFLGTTRQQDRDSAIHASAVVFGDTKWVQANRIKMKTNRVDPGELAEFSFIGHAPEQPGIYREYFAPLVEGGAWITNGGEATFDLKVGDPNEDESILKFTRDLDLSINLLDPLFYGEKKIIVSLSKQKMWLNVGDFSIKTYNVSSGKPKTPTPPGTTKIILKQEVRVAGEAPHYIMPKYMMFRAGGYGIHALPSLANDHGVFWREALNHIGSARSHGCIRLLPKDAEFAYKFADVGTTVQVVW